MKVTVLICFFFLSTQQISAIKMNYPRVLLPIFEKLSINFTLEVIEGGCFKWSSSRLDLISITPVFDNKQNSECTSKAVVTTLSREKGRSTAFVLAKDLSTGELLRCDVILDVIDQLGVLTTTRELYLEEAPETFELWAQDSQGNAFTTLEGVEFDWRISSQSPIEAKEGVLRFVRFSESKYHNVPATVKNFDRLGIRGYMVLLEGINSGSAKVTVQLPYSEYNGSVMPIEVNIMVLGTSNAKNSATLNSNQSDRSTLKNSFDANDHLDDLKRIRASLIEIRSHLIGQQEEYLRPMQSKINNMNNIRKVKRLLQGGASISGEIVASKIRFMDNVENTLKKVLLINGETEADNISTICQKLKTVNTNIKSLLENTSHDQRGVFKRSPVEEAKWFGDVLHVDRLHLKNQKHSLNGLITKNTPNSTYHLNGKVKTTQLITKTVSQSINVQNNDQLGTNHTVLPLLQTERLSYSKKVFVKSINGVDWGDFSSTVYRKGNNAVINGNIILAETASIRSLFTNDLNNIQTADFMTISTQQVIESNTFISQMHVNDVQSTVFNQMKQFADNVVKVGENNIIDSRVKIFVCNISGSLLLSDAEGEEFTQHIVGTRLEDLTQIYNGRILIKGSLSLKNVFSGNFFSQPIQQNSFQPNRDEPTEFSIIVNDTPFDLLNVAQQFWMKSVDQNFGDLVFNQPIISPQITANTLNMHPSNEFFILSEALSATNSHLALSVMFQNEVLIGGNLNTDSHVKTILQQLSSEAVKRFDRSRVTVTSPISFKNRLIVNHIGMLFETNGYATQNDCLNGGATGTNKMTLFDNTVRKRFSQYLFIENDLAILSENPSDARIHSFNEHSALLDNLNSMIRFNQPLSIAGVVIFDQNFNADHVTIAKFIDNFNRSNYQFDKYFELNYIFSDIYRLRQSGIQTLVVNGSVLFDHAEPIPKPTPDEKLTIKTLNGIVLSDFLSIVVSAQDNTVNGKSIEIGGVKTFDGNVNVQFATANAVNQKIFLNDWMANSLRKQFTSSFTQQVVGGFYWQFDTLVAENFQVLGPVNNIRIQPSSELQWNSDAIIVDSDPTKIINITSYASFASLTINPYADLSTTQLNSCNINPLFGQLVYLKQNYWNYLTVTKDIQISGRDMAPPKQSLSNFFKNAVLYDADQLIPTTISIKCNTSEKVTFNRLRVSASGSLKTRRSRHKEKREISSPIDDFSLETIYKDAVTKAIISLDGRIQPIIIRGQKEFHSDGVICNSLETISTGNFFVESINQVNVKQLNDTLMRRNSNVIHIGVGQHLQFLQAPSIEKFNVNGNQTIGGAHLDDIFFVYSPRQNQSNPPLRFDRSDAFSITNGIHSTGSVEINLLNDISLRYFIENRVRVHNEPNTGYPAQILNGYLTFENLIVSGTKTKIEQINDIFCDDVVLATNSGEQQISGFKEIIGQNTSLFLNKPFHTWKINEIEVTPAYLKTVFLNQNYTVDQLTIRSPYQLDASGGLVVLDQLNGNTIDNYMVRNVQTPQVDESIPVTEHLDKIKAKKLNYIDTSEEFKINYDATTTLDLKNETFLRTSWLTIESFHTENLNKKKPHEFSVCPVQYHVQKLQWPSKQLTVRRTKVMSRLLTVSIRADYIVQSRTEYPPDRNYYDKCDFSGQNQADDTPKSIVYLNYQEIFRFPAAIVESLHVFGHKNRIYLVLHLFNEGIHTYKQNEQLQWLEVSVIPLPKPNMRYPTVFNVRIFTWQTFNMLAVSSCRPPSASSADENPALRTTLYLFNDVSEDYTQMNSIAGDFNIIGGVSIPSKQFIGENTAKNGSSVMDQSDFYLILAKQGKHFLKFYKATALMNANQQQSSIHFQLTQDIQFDDNKVESISLFTEYGTFYVAIILNGGRFHIYQHTHTHFEHKSSWIDPSQSMWHSKLSGYFDQGKAMVPFTVNKQLYLFVLNEIDHTNTNKTTKSSTKIAKIFTLNYY